MADNVIKVDGDFSGVTSGLAGVNAKMKATGDGWGAALTGGVAGGIAGAAVNITAQLAAMGIQGGIALGKAVMAGLKDSAFAAADAQETLNRFESVFKDQAAAAGKWAYDLASAVGRSRVEIQSGLSDFQSFFVGMGFGGEQATKFSKKLAAAAIDFASFNNLQDADAANKFLAAISGETEGVKRFGIVLNEAALAQHGITKKSTEAQKAVARLGIIMETLGEQGALGDAIKTAGSFSNQWKAINSVIADTYVKVGQELLPKLEEIGPAIHFIIGELGSLAVELVELGLAFTNSFGGEGFNSNAERVVAAFARIHHQIKLVTSEAKAFAAYLNADKNDMQSIVKMYSAMADAERTQNMTSDEAAQAAVEDFRRSNAKKTQDSRETLFRNAEDAKSAAGQAALRDSMRFGKNVNVAIDEKSIKAWEEANKLPAKELKTIFQQGTRDIEKWESGTFTVKDLMEVWGEQVQIQTQKMKVDDDIVGKMKKKKKDEEDPFIASFESLDGLFKRIQGTAASDPVLTAAQKTAKATERLVALEEERKQRENEMGLG